MKISNSYPYPVLYKENDDYYHSDFEVEFKVDDSFGELKIKGQFILQNEGIQNLIENEMATFMVHMECPQTSFRKTYLSKGETILISVKNHYLRGKVFVHSFVIAQKKISNYTNQLLNEWYKDTSINFEKGNFLAIGNAIEVMLLEENIEHMNLPSIVSIYKSKEKEIMEIELHAHNIGIMLPEFEYEQYEQSANSMLKNTILSLIIMPCLLEVFSRVAENKEEYEEYTWYQVIERLFRENGHSISDVGSDSLSALAAAQLVLQKPLKTSFEEIEKFHRLGD
ncbi:hypothetical protein [Bacillus luti]|uniref:hypothetical protein n=1 Tax=Bacillus luti TaxID=2026191 RepID=UPI0012E84938|nr:hypothetical protein [Bacillus luti]